MSENIKDLKTQIVERLANIHEEMAQLEAESIVLKQTYIWRSNWNHRYYTVPEYPD
jgi:hypothetical protein